MNIENLTELFCGNIQGKNSFQNGNKSFQLILLKYTFMKVLKKIETRYKKIMYTMTGGDIEVEN